MTETTLHQKRLLKMKDIMVAKGMKHLGEGVSGHVFQSKNTGHVIKIFKPDKGYISFLKLIHKNKDNPHFPRIRKLVSFKHKNNKGLHLIKLEKLHPISYKEWRANGIGDYLKHDYLQTDDRYADRDTYKDSAEKFKTNHPRLAEALDKVIKNSKSNLDIGLSNVMKRDNGDFVITDPYDPF
jgi:uncharacterized protein Usg